MTISLAAVAWLSLSATDWTAAEHTTVRLLAATPAEECLPACRAGFVCARGACISACNPPCAAGEQCTAQGECVATGAPVPLPTGQAPGAMTREQIYREIDHQREMMPSTAGLKVMLGLNLPFFALAIIGMVIDFVFVGLGANLERSEGLLISLIVCAVVATGTGAVSVLGFVLLALRAAEAAPYQRRIDELDQMLRSAQAHAVPWRARPTLTLVRF